MYQVDAQHTGRSPYAGPRKLAVVRSFDTAKVDAATPVFPSPDIQSSAALAADGTIYIAQHSGTLFALTDAGEGDQLAARWRFHPPGESSWHATPALGQNGDVYLGFSTGGGGPEAPPARGTFYALRAPRAGLEPQVVWSVDLGPGRQTSSPTIGPDGTLYVVSGVGRLVAVSPEGTVKWDLLTGPSLRSAPALGRDGTVYLASMDDHLYAVSPPPSESPERARVEWKFAFGAHLGPSPVVTAKPPPAGADGIGTGASPTVGPDGTVYLGANNSNFYAIAPDGTLKWLYEAEREIAGIWSTAALSEDGSTVYFGANKGGIYALATEDGSPRWRFEIPGSVYSSPLLDNRGVLYTGSTVGHVFALDAATGRLVDDYNVGAPVWSAPSLRHDGRLVIADRRGRVLLLADPSR
jgi:outer membrane protein assembly factor BamB